MNDDNHLNNSGSMPISMGAVGCIFAGCVLLVVIWMCVLSARRNRRNSSTRISDSGDQQGEDASLSQKQKEEMLIEYFQRSSHQMKVKEDDLLPCPTTILGDLETGFPMSNEDNSMEDYGEDNCDCVMLRVDRSQNGKRGSSDARQLTGEDTTTSSPKGEARFQRPDSVNEIHPVASCVNCAMEEENCRHETVRDNTPPAHHQLVTDSCAICLERYKAGDTVVWSCMETCPHVFHRECFVGYLSTYRGKGTPCPICRRAYDCDETVFCLSCQKQEPE